MSKRSPLFYTPKPKEKPKARKWSVLRIVKKAFLRTCTLIGALFLLSFTISLIATSFLFQKQIPTLKDNVVLALEIEGPIPEQPLAPSLTDPLKFTRMTLLNTLVTLDNAKKDERVKGLILSIKSGGQSLASIQELRQALKQFREAGKFVKVYTQSFSDFGNSTGLYYLSAAADEIWMQPVGSLSITGIHLEMPFFKDAFAEIGIKPEFYQRKEYKTAFENFTASKMSEAAREMNSILVSDLGMQIVSDIATDRNLETADIKSAIDVGLLMDEEALEMNLIDGLAYYDEFVRTIKENLTGDPESKDIDFINLSTYKNTVRLARASGNTPVSIAGDKSRVGLVYVDGPIMQEDSAASTAFIPSNTFVSANKVASTLYKASREDDLEAIVLRVNSPGGSPSASETIRRAVEVAKSRGKKVMVSMAGTAASGGYWVATDADMIMASPATLTGSIGVVGGKFVLSEMWDKLKINWDTVSFGESSDFWSPNNAFDDAEQQRMNTFLDNTYEAFLDRVEQGRDMPRDRVREFAQGRVWTGRQAQENGLIDKTGGILDALDETARLIGKGDRQDLVVITMPRPKSTLEQIVDLFQNNLALAGVTQSLHAKVAALNDFLGFEMIPVIASGNRSTYDDVRIIH